MEDVLLRPLITEKSMQEAQRGKFSFAVKKGANKDVIKIVIEKLFNVHVRSVAVSLIKGKSHRSGARRVEVKDAPFKKAVVKLKDGEKIPLFEAVGGTE